MKIGCRFLSIVACVAGLVSSASAQSIVLARIKGDGTPNTQFGYNGGQLTNIPGATEAGYQVLRDPGSGKLIVGGVVADPMGRFLLVRYKTDGTVDTTFGTNGFVRTTFNGCSIARGLSMTFNTGKTAIIMGGICLRASDGKQIFAVARYTLAGTLVDSFSNDGRATGDIPDAASNPGLAVGVFSDDTVTVVGGPSGTLARDRMGLMAWNNADGSKRAQFGTDGIAASLQFKWAQDMATHPTNGRVYITGPYDFPDVAVLAVTSVNKSGNFSITAGVNFGSDYDYAQANAITVDDVYGKIVVAGQNHHATSATKEDQFAIARLTTAGEPDITFSGDGMTSTDFSSCDGEGIADVFVYPGGPQARQTMACGTAFHLDSGRSQFALARYNFDGSLDTSFDGDGKVLYDFGLHVAGYGCVDDGNGGVVIVGTTLQ